jgi:hypothetical protein
MVAKSNSCFWLAEIKKKNSPLKLGGTMIVFTLKEWCMGYRLLSRYNSKKIGTVYITRGQWPWAEYVPLTCHFVLRKLSIDISYQILINLAKWIKRFFLIGQSLTAILFIWLACNIHSPNLFGIISTQQPLPFQG